MHKKAKRLTMVFLSLALTLSFGMSAAAKGQPASPGKPGTYQSIIEIEDWGATITKVIVDLGQPVPVGSVTKDTFNVHVKRYDDRLPDPFLGEGDRTVTNAYVSDKKGNSAQNGWGKYAVLEMSISPTDPLGQALNWYYQDQYNKWVDYQYTITQVKDIDTHDGVLSGLVINKLSGETRKLVDDFHFGEGTYDGVKLTYADFKPAVDKVKNPLIIWLHGAGEGGTDPSLPLSANKADTFASEETQAHFGGAYILVPQTPTFWMDGYNGFADGTSIYEDALMTMIREYVAKHPDIDPNRIYVGGLSNGGYMTMLLTRDYPGYFAAALAVCEGLNDELVSDQDIQKLIQTPTWFVAAKTDFTLPPAENATPTYERMVETGADHVHYSLFENVHDTSGLYFQEDGVTPYEYYGHFSWIYVYNNVPTDTIHGKETTIYDWLAAQSLK